MERNIIDAYLKFMWNADIPAEFHEIFDCGVSNNPYSKGSHILYQWTSDCEECGRIGAAAVLWSKLDKGAQEAIVKRAMEWQKENR